MTTKPRIISTFLNKRSDHRKGTYQTFTSRRRLLSLTGLTLLLAGLTAATSLSLRNLDYRSDASVSGVDLAFVPSVRTVALGEQVTWDIYINTLAHSVTSIQLEINYDSSAYDFVSLVPGNTLSEVLAAGTATGNLARLTLGVKPRLNNAGPPPDYEIIPFTGSGTLAKLTLKAKNGVTYNQSKLSFSPDRGDGTGTIALTREMSSANVIGDLGYSNLTLGTVSVSSTATPTPTPTPTPTIPTPTTTASPPPTPPPSQVGSSDIVRVLSARVTKQFLRFVRIEVIATSSEQPTAELTVSGYGQMSFREKSRTYFKTFWTRNPPTFIKVTSSAGGSADATINTPSPAPAKLFRSTR